MIVFNSFVAFYILFIADYNALWIVTIELLDQKLAAFHNEAYIYFPIMHMGYISFMLIGKKVHGINWEDKKRTDNQRQ